jgi:protein-S-isoprenylcysteine O-methyltransferase Ste14
MLSSMSFSRLVPLVLRHLDAYTEIAEKDAQDALSAMARRAALAMIAFAAAFVSVLMACIGIIAVSWEGPHRVLVPVALAIAFAAVAALTWLAARRHRAGNPTKRTKK